MMQGRSALLAIGAVAFVVACKPSKEEIDKAIDQRLAERGLAPLPAASASVSTSASASTPAAPPSVTKDPVATSLAFLERLTGKPAITTQNIYNPWRIAVEAERIEVVP